MHPSNFDELTKTLAETRSRRQALRVILTASIGGLLGLTSISTAFGRHRAKLIKPSGPPPCNSKCAKFCAAVFGPNTPAANQCTSDAAHNKSGNLCGQCNGASTSVCCNRNGSGFCDGTAGATCCDTSQCQTCSSGVCVSACLSGQMCCGGTCAHCCGNSDCASGETCVGGQ